MPFKKFGAMHFIYYINRSIIATKLISPVRRFPATPQSTHVDNMFSIFDYIKYILSTFSFSKEIG